MNYSSSKPDNNRKNSGNESIKSKNQLPIPNNNRILKELEPESIQCLSNLNLRKAAYAGGFIFRLCIYLIAVFYPEIVIFNLFGQNSTPDTLKIFKFHAYIQLVPLIMATAAMIIESERSKILNVMLIVNDAVTIWTVYTMNETTYSYISISIIISYVISIIDNLIVYIYSSKI